MKVISKATPTAVKLMIHGLSGSGKTSLAAKLTNPLILDFEGGANFLDVPRTEQITDLDTFYTYLVELYRTDHKLKTEDGEVPVDTIVIDSADWLVRKVTEKAAGIDKDNLDVTLNKSNGGYGNGKLVLINHIRTKLLPTLVALNKKGYGVCLIAHSERKDLMDADGVDTTRITPKIDINTMEVMVEWCDSVFYLKNVDGERYLVLEGDENILAKNRQNLTGEVKLSEVDINGLLMPKVNKKGDK